MDDDIDPRLIALFGSETRVRTLAVLAGAHRPMTAYRVGRVGEMPLPMAYREIDRLATAGLIGRSGRGWVLLDGDVRALLLKRVRVSWADDWFSERARRVSAETPLLRQIRRAPIVRPPQRWRPRNPKRFNRSPTKDRILREMGLRTSIHAD
jgi:hypothetical protein